MSKVTWLIIASGLLSAWFYKKSQGPEFEFFTGEDEES